MRESKKVYEYSGPVIVDGQRATWNWTARTWAVSPQKARSNLVHRFKEQNNLGRNNNNVILDGPIMQLSNKDCAIEFAKSENFYPRQLVLDI